MKLKSWLKEPLVHFLIAGAGLFLVSSALEGEDRSGRTIRISREDLLVFMQGRAQVYDDATFSALLARMKPEERRQLIHDVALQEALRREGEALDLAAADPLIRLRVVQQMRLLLMEEAAADMSVSDAEVGAFFDRNKQQYALPAVVTFTHVFLPGSGSRSRARDVLARLRAGKVPFERSGEFGERFLYQTNYVDAAETLVESHFGPEFARTVSGLEPGRWQGPVQSEHGWHLVLVSRHINGGMPDLAAIEANVREDALAEKRQKAANAALDRMLERYEIVVDGQAEG